MWRDKGPGVKILWIWLIGTAAVLVTNVARTRMRDMEQMIKAQSQEQQRSSADATESVMTDQPFDSNFRGTPEEKL